MQKRALPTLLLSIWLWIPDCCLIPAGLKWHKPGDSFDISDVPLTHRLCEVALNFLALTVPFRGDSEEIVKELRSNIGYNLLVWMGDDIFGCR